MLVMAPQIERIEGVRAVERIAGVVTVSAAIVKQHDPGKPARAVRAKIPPAPSWFVSKPHKQFVHVMRRVESVDNAGPVALRANLARRLEFPLRFPWAYVLQLRAELVPFSPKRQKLRGDIR